MPKGLKKYIVPLIIFFISFFILFFRLSSSVAFVGDFGRDLYEIAKIASGNLTLLWPKGSFGGLYTTPYYYYLFVIPFILGGKSLIGVLLFNCFLFVSESLSATKTLLSLAITASALSGLPRPINLTSHLC